MKKIFTKFALNSERTTKVQIDATYVKTHQHSAGAKKNGGLKKRLLEN